MKFFWSRVTESKNYEYAREQLYLLKGVKAERVIGMIWDKPRNLN